MRNIRNRQPVAGAFGGGQKPTPPAPPPPAPASAPSVPAQPAIPTLPPPAPPPPTPTPPVQKPAPKPEPVATTVAGKKEYDAFFSLYHQWVESGHEGEFIPLGFIPGSAIVVRSGWLVAATPDLRLKPGDELLAPVTAATTAWRLLVTDLGCSPSPWSSGFARRLLSGKMPGRYFAAAMTRFRYRPGDREVSFGVVLLPAEDGMMLSRVYNPWGIPDVPAVGEVLSFAVLKDGRGPVQKLLRTWALMEANYASRYGAPRPPTPPAASF